MKLIDIIDPSPFDRRGRVMTKLPNFNDKRSLKLLTRTKPAVHTYIRSSSATGKVYNRSTIVEK